MRELNDIELNQVSGGTGYRITSLDFFGDLRYNPEGPRHEPSIDVVNLFLSGTPKSPSDRSPQQGPRPVIDLKTGHP